MGLQLNALYAIHIEKSSNTLCTIYIRNHYIWLGPHVLLFHILQYFVNIKDPQGTSLWVAERTITPAPYSSTSNMHVLQLCLVVAAVAIFTEASECHRFVPSMTPFTSTFTQPELPLVKPEFQANFIQHKWYLCALLFLVYG